MKPWRNMDIPGGLIRLCRSCCSIGVFRKADRASRRRCSSDESGADNQGRPTMARHSGWRWLGLFAAFGACAAEPVDWKPAALLNPPAAKIGVPIPVIQPRPLPDRFAVDHSRISMTDSEEPVTPIEKVSVAPRVVSQTVVAMPPKTRSPILPTPDLDRPTSPYHPVKTEMPRPFIPNDAPAARLARPAQ